MQETLSIVVCHAEDETRADLCRKVESLSYEVIATPTNGRELIADVLRLHADVIVTGISLDDMDGIEALVSICRHEPKPSVIVTDEAHMDKVEEALQDHVMAYLIEPVDENDLRATLYLVRRRFEQFEELRKEIGELKSALAGRKSIERAKGVLMRKQGLDEESAYKRLRKLANDKRKSIVDVAEALLLAEEIS